MRALNVNHKLAEETSAIERYLLNDMPDDERSAFESHFFECGICAERIRDGAAFVESARQVFREQTFQAETQRERSRESWFRWLRMPVLVPSCSALVMAAFIVYQNAVSIPALLKPRILSTVVVAPLSREAPPVIKIAADQPLFNVTFSVDAPRAFVAYNCEFRDRDGKLLVRMRSEGHELSSFDLSFLLPAAKFPDGAYQLIVQPAGGNDGFVDRYTFEIQKGLPK